MTRLLKWLMLRMRDDQDKIQPDPTKQAEIEAKQQELKRLAGILTGYIKNKPAGVSIPSWLKYELGTKLLNTQQSINRIANSYSDGHNPDYPASLMQSQIEDILIETTSWLVKKIAEIEKQLPSPTNND